MTPVESTPVADCVVFYFRIRCTIQHTADAVNAGLSMIARLEEMNAGLAGTDIPGLGIGCGVHTGAAIVGSMSSDVRLESTAIGDTVNPASRIESLTRSVGEPLLMTRDTGDGGAYRRCV